MTKEVFDESLLGGIVVMGNTTGIIREISRTGNLIVELYPSDCNILASTYKYSETTPYTDVKHEQILIQMEDGKVIYNSRKQLESIGES